MEQRLRWRVYECDVRVEVATGDGVSAPVTAASHVTLSHCTMGLDGGFFEVCCVNT